MGMCPDQTDIKSPSRALWRGACQITRDMGPDNPALDNSFSCGANADTSALFERHPCSA